MTSFFRILGALIALATIFAMPAQALQCKSDSVTATSRLYLSKSFGAYPGSWAAWRKKVKADVGNGWQAWRRAKKTKIECNRVKNDNGRNRWQCTRSGTPCRPGKEDHATADAQCDDYPVITEKLRRRSDGGQVKMLQCLLTAHGFKIKIDGDFGSSTVKAVREFQKKNKLSIDGVVGDLTAEKLSS